MVSKQELTTQESKYAHQSKTIDASNWLVTQKTYNVSPKNELSDLTGSPKFKMSTQKQKRIIKIFNSKITNTTCSPTSKISPTMSQTEKHHQNIFTYKKPIQALHKLKQNMNMFQTNDISSQIMNIQNNQIDYQAQTGIEEPEVSISGWVKNGNESLCESDRNINGAMIGKFNNNEMGEKEIQKKYRSFLQNNKKDFNRRKSLFNYPIANVLRDENSVLLRNFKSIDLNSKIELIQNIENSLGTLYNGYRVGYLVKEKQLKENQMIQKSAEYHLKNFDFPKTNSNNPFILNPQAHVHQQFVHTNIKQKQTIDYFVNYIQTLIAPNSMCSKFHNVLFDNQGLIKNKTNRIGFDRLVEQMEKDRKKFCEMIVKDRKSLNEIIQELYKQSLKKQNLDQNIDNNLLKKVQRKTQKDNKEDLYEQLENELQLQGMKMRNRISPSISTNTDPFQTIQTQTVIESKKTQDPKNDLQRKDSIIEPWQAGSLNYEKQSSKIDEKKEKVADEYKIDSLIQCALKEDSQNKIYQIYQSKNDKTDPLNNKDIELEYDKSSYRKIGTAMGTDQNKIQTSLLNENENKSPKSPNISCNKIQNSQAQIIVNSNRKIQQDHNNEQKSSDTTLQTQQKLTFKHVQSFNKIPDIIKNNLIQKKKKKKHILAFQQNEKNSSVETIEKKKLKRIFLNNQIVNQKYENIIDDLIKQDQKIKESSNEKIQQQEINEDAQYDDIQAQIKYFSENNDNQKPTKQVQRAGSYISNRNFHFENVAIQEFKQRQNTEEMLLHQNYLRQQLKKPSTPVMAKRLQNSRISIGKKRQTIQNNLNNPLSLGQIQLVGQNYELFDQKQYELLNADYLSNIHQRNNTIGGYQNEILSYQFSNSSGNETAQAKVQKKNKLQSLQTLSENKAFNQLDSINNQFLKISGQQFPLKADNSNGIVNWQPVEVSNHPLSIENKLKQEQLRQIIIKQHQIVQQQNQSSLNKINAKQNVSPMSGKEYNKCVQLSVKIDPIQNIQKESSMEYIKTTKNQGPSNDQLKGHYNIKIQDELETIRTNRKTQNYTELNRREFTNEKKEEDCNSEYRDPQSQMNGQINKKLVSKYPEAQQIYNYEPSIQNNTFGTVTQQEQNYQFESFQAQNKINEDFNQNKSSRLNYMNESFIDRYEMTKIKNFDEHSNLKVNDFSNLLIKNVQQQNQQKETEQNDINVKNGISKMNIRKYLQYQSRLPHTADGLMNPRRSKTPQQLKLQQNKLGSGQILQITPMSNQMHQSKQNSDLFYQAIQNKNDQYKTNQMMPQSAIILYQRNQQQKLQQLSQGSKALNGLLMQQNERQFIKPSLFIKRQNQLKKILQELNNRKALVIDESKINQMIQNENFESLLENPNQILENIKTKKKIDLEGHNFQNQSIQILKQNQQIIKEEYIQDHPLETVSILSITQNKDLIEGNIQPQYFKNNNVPSPVSTVREIVSGGGRTQIISKRNQSNESRSNESVHIKQQKNEKLQKIISNTATHHYYQQEILEKIAFKNILQINK